MPTIRRCCIAGCMSNSRQNPQLQFFQFPKPDNPFYKLWTQACHASLSRILPFKKPVVCAMHFHPSCIGGRRLTGSAIPTLKLEVPTNLKAVEQQAMVDEIEKSRKCAYINAVVYEWLVRANLDPQLRGSITHGMIKEKAESAKQIIACESFMADNRWLNRFRESHLTGFAQKLASNQLKPMGPSLWIPDIVQDLQHLFPPTSAERIESFENMPEQYMNYIKQYNEYDDDEEAESEQSYHGGGSVGNGANGTNSEHVEQSYQQQQQHHHQQQQQHQHQQHQQQQQQQQHLHQPDYHHPSRNYYNHSGYDAYLQQQQQHHHLATAGYNAYHDYYSQQQQSQHHQTQHHNQQLPHPQHHPHSLQHPHHQPTPPLHYPHHTGYGYQPQLHGSQQSSSSRPMSRSPPQAILPHHQHHQSHHHMTNGTGMGSTSPPTHLIPQRDSSPYLTSCNANNDNGNNNPAKRNKLNDFESQLQPLCERQREREREQRDREINPNEQCNGADDSINTRVSPTINPIEPLVEADPITNNVVKYNGDADADADVDMGADDNGDSIGNQSQQSNDRTSEEKSNFKIKLPLTQATTTTTSRAGSPAASTSTSTPTTTPTHPPRTPTRRTSSPSPSQQTTLNAKHNNEVTNNNNNRCSPSASLKSVNGGSTGVLAVQTNGNSSLSPTPSTVVTQIKEIETYEQALEYLKPLEDFALFKENFRAIGLISQLEIVLKKGERPTILSLVDN